MTIHVLVEGSSERAFLDGWLPRLRLTQPLSVHHHQGKGRLPTNLNAAPDPRKRGLLDQLPAKLRGYASSLNRVTDSILVLVDSDDDDVANLIAEIQAAANHCCPEIALQVCIAVEEMEAFYLADLAALRRGYPVHDAAMARAYEPDSICGTWELFGRVIGDDGGNKVAWAERMGAYVTTDGARSRSPSFRLMLSSFNVLNSQPSVMARKARKYRRAPKKR